MEKMTADALRESFLKFFRSHDHRIVESDSLVPRDDPTVLFTPAGMNQFKKEFLGFDSGFKRAATAQRCLRTDDLDKVGKTSGHHTFFEMLGNFSFGGYFKDEAIALAWEFLTEKLSIKKERLWVSVYKDDDESYQAWNKKIRLPAEKIVRLGDKENFWPSEAKEKGPNGPCGPCSEIFFDQGRQTGCRQPDCNPSCNCGRFVEVWNLVFTQFNRKEGAILEPLPNRNIDTGMGLERLAAVMQNVPTNFETELFQPIIREIVSNRQCRLSDGQKEGLFAVADHIRAITFSIYDGVIPANEDRGYVIRKLIRKSTLHLRAMGFEKPFLYTLVPVLADIMKAPYPELHKRKENLSGIILNEEKNFIVTLNSSGRLFAEKFAGTKRTLDPDTVGRISFQLYDTYGIPLELTCAWLKDKGVTISRNAFDEELRNQKSRSQAGSSMKGDVFSHSKSYSGLKETKFLGYKESENKAKILAVISCSKETRKIDRHSGPAEIVLDKTCFYPESGGQVGDTGQIKKGKSIFLVESTKRTGTVIIHTGTVTEGVFKKGDTVSARISLQRRRDIARNHTATHLLQAALRKVLGEHVRQEGSLVAQERLRFDFTHFKDIDREQINRIEEVVNGYILDNHPLATAQMSLSEAKKKGALAFFAEKYGQNVRVVSVDGVSQELCAGTHLASTAEVGLFKIVQEGSVASGIRRIEAVTGAFAYRAIKKEESILEEISEELNVPLERLAAELGKKASRIKELEKLLMARQIDSVKSNLESIIQEAETVKGVKLIARLIEGLDMNLLRKNVDLIKQKTSGTIVALASSQQERVFLVLGVTDDLAQKGFSASELIKEPARILGGSGGGRNDFAQAGGKNPLNVSAAFAALKEALLNRP